MPLDQSKMLPHLTSTQNHINWPEDAATQRLNVFEPMRAFFVGLAPVILHLGRNFMNIFFAFLNLLQFSNSLTSRCHCPSPVWSLWWSHRCSWLPALGRRPCLPDRWLLASSPTALRMDPQSDRAWCQQKLSCRWGSPSPQPSSVEELPRLLLFQTQRWSPHLQLRYKIIVIISFWI